MFNNASHQELTQRNERSINQRMWETLLRWSFPRPPSSPLYLKYMTTKWHVTQGVAFLIPPGGLPDSWDGRRGAVSLWFMLHNPISPSALVTSLSLPSFSISTYIPFSLITFRTTPKPPTPSTITTSSSSTASGSTSDVPSLFFTKDSWVRGDDLSLKIWVSPQDYSYPLSGLLKN